MVPVFWHLQTMKQSQRFKTRAWNGKGHTSTKPKRKRTKAICWYGIDKAISNLCNLSCFFPDDFRCSFVVERPSKGKVAGYLSRKNIYYFKCIESRHLETCAHANCSKSMYFLKLRFNKPTVCFLRRREVFYSVSGGSLIPALRSCSSIDLAHDPTCISRFEYIIYIIYINIYSQKHYMYPKIPGLFGWCSSTQANPHLTGILIKYRTNI